MAKPRLQHKDEAPEAVEVTASAARNQMGDMIDRALGGQRFKILRHGKAVAALVTADDLEALTGAA